MHKALNVIISTTAEISDDRVIAEVIGEMIDGRKVWQDKEGNQYLMTRFNSKQYFVPIGHC